LGRASSLAAINPRHPLFVECVQAKTNVADQRLNTAYKALQPRRLDPKMAEAAEQLLGIRLLSGNHSDR
jgi:uncharacterized protein YecT (DUF1311 family)